MKKNAWYLFVISLVTRTVSFYHRHLGCENIQISRAQSAVVRNPPAKARDRRDAGSILESGRSPGWGNANPLQYSCLGNLMDRGTWWLQSMGWQKSQTWLSTHALQSTALLESLASFKGQTKTNFYFTTFFFFLNVLHIKVVLFLFFTLEENQKTLDFISIHVFCGNEVWYRSIRNIY